MTKSVSGSQARRPDKTIGRYGKLSEKNVYSLNEIKRPKPSP